MIYVVFQWQVKKQFILVLSNIGVVFGEIRIEVGVEIGLLNKGGIEFGVLFDEIGIEDEILFSEVGAKVRFKIRVIILDSMLIRCDDDVGEGFFFLMREKFFFEEDEDEEEEFDEEQIVKLK